MTGDGARMRLVRLGLWLVAANVVIVSSAMGLAMGLGSGAGGGAGEAVRGFVAWCGIG
jgi:hypothetical protein